MSRKRTIGNVGVSGNSNIITIVIGNSNTLNVDRSLNLPTEINQTTIELNSTFKSERLVKEKVIENSLTYFVDRPKERNQLVKNLLDDQNGSPNLIALWGPGGCGKTALALVACCEAEVIAHFTGGIFWVDLGKEGDAVEGMKILYEQLVGSKPISSTAKSLSNEFLNKWSNEPQLIVLDNLQNSEELRQFFLCLKSNCTWLITTRNKRSFAAERPLKLTQVVIQIDTLRVAELALIICYELSELYEIEIDDMSELFNKSQVLVAQLYGFPLLLNLVKTEIENRVCSREPNYKTICMVLEGLLDEVQQVGWFFYMNQLSETFKASFECLSKEEREALEELVIFPENQNIPISVLSKLWGSNRVHTTRYCEHLFGLSLLQRCNLEKGTVRINNVLRQYFLENQEIRKNRPKIHRKLLRSYEEFYQISLNLDNEAEIEAVLKNLHWESNEEKKYIKGFYQYHMERAK